jgi:RHS repeat-associated protein
VSERLLRISDGSGVANNTNTANTANNEQGNEIARYAYDPFGRRIKKTVSQNPSGQGSTGTTLYFYADEGLIAEVDGNSSGGNITTTYGWMPNNTWGTAPQWKRDHAGQSGATDVQGSANTNGITHYVHVDHLGTSQRLTNTQGETTWRAVSEAFGKTFIDTTLAPATTGTTTNNLRFPGQYEDSETGTHYNYMRTYLPMVGRYGETDPIGLGGGLNTYSYVGGNPVSYIDPTGEFLAVPILVGGLIGGGIDVAIQLAKNGGNFDCVSWGQVGISAAAGAAFSGLGPTGFLLGRGGQRAAQFGYSESAGILNHGSRRFGWGYRESDNSNVLRLVIDNVKADLPGAISPVARPIRDGLIAGAVGGGAVGAASDCTCKR